MKILLDHVPDGIKAWLDALSFTALFGSLMSILPDLSLLLTVVWMAIRVYETETVQRLTRRREIDDGR